MLVRLELKNCFKHADRVINFTKGLTAITGPNESGKSLIFEMISYALFGSVALRGTSEDYKKLSVALEFFVSGKAYRVTRKGSTVLLSVGGHELATGTKIVNPKIVEILGYDYKVFSIANCANQDELTKLGNMKPTERKQMVDNVIGLTIIDDLNKFVSGNIAALTTQIETLRTIAAEPVAPAKPEGYMASADVQRAIDVLVPKEQRFNYLNHWLQGTRSAPVAPVDPGFGDVQELLNQSQAQHVKQMRKSELDNILRNYVAPTMTMEGITTARKQWNDYEQLVDLQTQLARLAPPPLHTKAQLDQWAKDAEQWQRWQEKHKLILMGSHNCPKCKHQWPVAADKLEQFKDVEACELPKIVPIPQHYAAIETYENQKAMRVDYEARIAALGNVGHPTTPKVHLAAQQAALELSATMSAHQKEWYDLKTYFDDAQPDYDGMLQKQQLYLQQVAGYNQALSQYNQWVAEWEANSKEIETVRDVPGQVAQLRSFLQAMQMYEYQHAQYLNAVTAYQQQLSNIEAKSIQLNQYERSRVALKEARSTVKKYLVPSLNRVASALLAQMTGGERSVIEVSEDFEIMVDGQPLNTLSGSGKAVANLAIRIALGQVLIAKKFPVFMADEIDGSMDADRAEFTSECLRRLTKHVPQLLLISHKRPEADHYIELGR